jgi:hypothetical protein
MILTTWNYTLTDVDEMPSLLTVEEFNSMTAGRYPGDVRISPMISAAESAIREYCGWHIADNQPCQASFLGRDKAVSKTSCDILVQLPATYVTEVTSVTINGTEVNYFDITTDGLLWIYDSWVSRHDKIVVNYSSGLPETLMGGIKELICHRVTHALAQSYGIQSEAAGGVSVTYSANWINSARATALPEDNKEVLSPYRLRRVF